MTLLHAFIMLLAAMPEAKDAINSLAAVAHRNHQLTEDEWTKWKGIVEGDLASPAFQPDPGT